MNITNVKIITLPQSKTLALANITLDNEIVITGLKVFNGKNGLFVAMPSQKNSKGEYHDIAFPITKEARQEIQDTVINKYNETVSYDREPVNHGVEYPQKTQAQREYDNIGVSSSDLPF